MHTKYINFAFHSRYAVGPVIRQRFFLFKSKVTSSEAFTPLLHVQKLPFCTYRTKTATYDWKEI